ncbi:unnamed protein product [Symbiodinium necroappetens]|uniref:Uncharacterized protein n=1 Tax=Symbiodinium necroappetens TaxID=1628268 RepID=A0A812KRX5_9DINO|nr:unnamed protein product [Symbiodinium necroappetens]
MPLPHRIFSSCEARDPAAASAAEEGTDYESHFRPARRRPAEALEVFEPGVGGSMPSAEATARFAGFGGFDLMQPAHL